MAQKSDVDLQIQRDEIESETSTGANTAARVGQMFEDIIDSKVNNDDGTPTSGLPPASTPLAGTELVALVQVGVDVQATAQDIADLGGGGTSQFRGASANASAFPSTGGSTGGDPQAGDMWNLTVDLSVGGNFYPSGTILLALINTPGQTLTNWAKLANQL